MPVLRPYAVVGATGRTGAATAHALIRAGNRVRVIVRDPSKGEPWAKLGAEVAIADLVDPEAMTAALRDVAGAYIVNPPHYTREDLFERAVLVADVVARASVDASVPKLVALSSVGADRHHGTGWIAMNRDLERILTETAIPTAFLRAAYFMENWTPMAVQSAASGTLPTFLAPSHRALSMIATADIGIAAAFFLQQQWSGTRAIGLEGPAPYSPADVANALTSMLGRIVDVGVIPETAWPDALSGAGYSRAGVAGFIEMTRGLNNGWIHLNSDAGAERWTGPTTLSRVIDKLALELRR